MRTYAATSGVLTVNTTGRVVTRITSGASRAGIEAITNASQRFRGNGARDRKLNSANPAIPITIKNRLTGWTHKPAIITAANAIQCANLFAANKFANLPSRKNLHANVNARGSTISQ